jgi:nucleoid-associated protein YgaU
MSIPCALPDRSHPACPPRQLRGGASQLRRRRSFAWDRLERVVAFTLVVVIAVLLALVPWGHHLSLARKEVIVRPGDTLIGIIERTYPGANPYPILYRVERETHGDVILPGERLTLPGFGGH